MNNIDNGFIQIGGKSIAISSCLPTFPPLQKKTQNIIKTNTQS